MSDKRIDLCAGAWQPAVRALPADHAVVAIGDVHGQADLLVALHGFATAEVGKLGVANATLIHLGDLIDRGPGNRTTLKLARSGVPGFDCITLKGNHEDRMLSAIEGSDPAILEAWLRYGADRVFAECGIAPTGRWRAKLTAALGEDLLDWVRALPSTHRIGDLFFVHAGIDPDRPLAEQDDDTFLWIRKPFITAPGPFEGGIAVIHGHTPVRRVDLDHPHRIDIDTRAFGSGCLSALLIAGDRMRLLQVRRR
jgi:serine/threonine protein phosphatase 1